ncbi:hypothetical protein HDU93_006423, partial [Gonapodya sp. JEL0774]
MTNISSWFILPSYTIVLDNFTSPTSSADASPTFSPTSAAAAASFSTSLPASVSPLPSASESSTQNVPPPNVNPGPSDTTVWLVQNRVLLASGGIVLLYLLGMTVWGRELKRRDIRRQQNGELPRNPLIESLEHRDYPFRLVRETPDDLQSMLGRASPFSEHEMSSIGAAVRSSSGLGFRSPVPETHNFTRMETPDAAAVRTRVMSPGAAHWRSPSLDGDVLAQIAFAEGLRAGTPSTFPPTAHGIGQSASDTLVSDEFAMPNGVELTRMHGTRGSKKGFTSGGM